MFEHTGTHASETLMPPLGGGSWLFLVEDICTASTSCCGGDPIPKSKNIDSGSSELFKFGDSMPMVPVG